MKNILVALIIGLHLFSIAYALETEKKNVGAIQGRILPEGVSIRIVAKIAGTDHEVEGNLKGEAILHHGGDFIIDNLPPGKYDLLFFLQGESAKKYMATRWSEIQVQPGKIVTGINYKLTPLGASYLIDEISVGFNKNITTEESIKIINSEGCILKDSPLDLGHIIYYLIHIPNDKSVEDMIKLFKNIEGVVHAEPNGLLKLQ
jgi:hypothetical protein